MNPWLYGAILLGLLLLKYRYIWSPRDTSILFRGRGKPLFVGHRGALFRGPENTLSAYRAALDAGLEALELDVVSTRDGEVVCSHNFDLERESDATGFINQITWDELQQVQTGVRHKERYPGGVKFDRLVDVIDALPEHVLLNIEIKPMVCWISAPPGAWRESSVTKSFITAVWFRVLIRLRSDG